MTEAEQLAVFNTPDWLTAFRTEVNTIFDALATQHARVPEIEFAVQGVPCRVMLDPGSPHQATACIGTKDDNTGWQFQMVAPIGWFRPS